MVLFESTTTPKSERLLANTLGYPNTWHVVRRVPHPILKTPNTFQDIIYSGDPKVSDAYFNHVAAMDVAMKWKEGESTPFDENGGQLLPLEVVELVEGDEVEVYYEDDSCWYHAIVTEVLQYKDDERYTVRYTVDDATQTNVCQDKIRKIKSKKKPKKRKSTASTTATSTPKSHEKSKRNKKKEIKKTASKKRKYKTDENERNSEEEDVPVEAPKKKRAKQTKLTQYIPNTSELHTASKMGLPEGWTAKVRSGSRYVIKSPDGKQKFTSKKLAFQHLGLPIPKHVHDHLDDDDEEEDGDEFHEVHMNINEEDVENAINIEDGDPPWRTSNHKYLGRKVEYTFPDGIIGKGKVIGWISDKDVDKNGNPGFVSENTGKAACLFHVQMDNDCSIESQDLEGYEVEEVLLHDEEKKK
mmetsp:Transcript_6540/g.7331  ORF Transcript_6540/g.7331 Transcript_6540/m.7331 type:complete len:413 (-) Transcript_6540:119-1357(-)